MQILSRIFPQKHLRAFLTDILEDLGFVTRECAKADDLEEILTAHLPDVVVVGVSIDGIEAGTILEILVRREFGGKVLANHQAVRDLCRRIPAHPAFGGLLIEVKSAEVIDNLNVLVDVAREVRLRNIAISIDDVGADWPALMGLETFPFAELKVDRQFVTGCANDRLKQTVCRSIIDLARGYGVRVVAEGIETRADFVAANEMGFDLVQGYLFGKPTALKKFARSALIHPVLAPK